MMKVELIYITPDAAKKIEEIACVCYDSKPTEDYRILAGCMDSGHFSVAEHSDITFKVTCSRACSHQLVRHRTNKYTQRSQRYCTEENFPYYIPETIKRNGVFTEFYNNAISKINEAYTELLEIGVPAEDARYLLPNACETTIIITMDFHNFFHFLNERLCVRAQKEIRDVAKEMKRLAIEACPVFKPWCVPKCEAHKIPYCIESKKNRCGKYKSLEELVNGTKYNRKPLICLLGISGSGKSTIANRLERKYGYISVKSYTTRPIREDDENDLNTHTFINLDEVEQFRDDIVADNWYNNNYYFATSSQLDKADIYIVDKEGLKTLQRNYHNKEIIPIWLDVPSELVAKRMEQRGDNNEAIMLRLQCDSEAFKGVKEMCKYSCDNSTQEQGYEIVEFINNLLRFYNG